MRSSYTRSRSASWVSVTGGREAADTLSSACLTLRAPGMTAVTPGWSMTQRSAKAAVDSSGPAISATSRAAATPTSYGTPEKVSPTSKDSPWRLKFRWSSAANVVDSSYLPVSSPLASGTRARMPTCARCAAGSSCSSGLRRKMLRMTWTVCTPGCCSAVSPSATVSTETPYAAIACSSTRVSRVSYTRSSEYTAVGGQCSCTRSRVSTPRLRRDRSIQARRFSGVYCSAVNGSARRPALVATNGRSPRAASALRIRSSERPSPYTSAVSSSVTPASSAASSTAAASSSETSPQSPPSCQVPRPTTETSAPVRPSGRVSRGVEEVSVIVRLRARSAPRSLALPAMLARASSSPAHRRTHPVEQLTQGDGDLLVGAQVAQLGHALGQVPVADDHRVAGAGAVGCLHRALEPAVAVDGVGGDPRLPQLTDELHREPLGVGSERDDERLHPGRGRDVQPLGLHRQQGAVDPHGVADAGQVRATQRGGQPVVAAAAADRRLRPEAGVHELERRLRVVVQPADQLGRLGPGHPEVGQVLPDGVVVRLGGVREVVDHQRGVVQLGLHLRALVVQHPQRVDLRAPPGVLVQVQLLEEGDQQLAVLRPAGGVAQRGEQQLEVAQPQVAEPLHAQRDDLGVQRRVVDPQRLAVDLGEVPVPARLRPLVAERRPDRPQLHRQGAGVQPVLDEGAHQPGGELGAQRDRPAAAVGERVHLLGDDVGRLPHPAGEHRGVLERRRLDVAVPGPAQRRGQRVPDGQELVRRRWQGVERSLGSPHGLGHHSPRPFGAEAASARYGLVARSRPIVVAGPCPGRTTVSSSSGRTTSRSEVSIASQDPPGRSTRPTEPANSTSPASSPGDSSRSTENITEPWVCPGACRTVSRTPARARTAPSSRASTSEGSGNRT